MCLELNEKQLIGDAEDLLEPIRVLRGAGVKIALDDVGYGRSHLEGLLVLQPDVIKIDRRCIDGISRDPELRATLERLLRMLTPLEAVIIAVLGVMVCVAALSLLMPIMEIKSSLH